MLPLRQSFPPSRPLINISRTHLDRSFDSAPDPVVERPCTAAMNRLISPLMVCLLVGSASSQYEQEGRGHQHNGQPPANILLHKQALGQDGSFNYAFAADNGLQQGEVINPDGSRKGSYSYVDPNGKTVSLSYTAGKDGFRVLNGDHLPKAPDPQQRPTPHYYQQQPLHYSQPPPPQQPPNYPLFRPNPVPYEAYRNSPNAPAYRGNPAPHEAYTHPHPPPPSSQFTAPPTHQAPYGHPPQAPHHHPTPNYRPRQYSVEEGGYDSRNPYPLPRRLGGGYRQEEPTRPHSFGNGYSFEFAG